jgi:hypothetical protein
MAFGPRQAHGLSPPEILRADNPDAASNLADARSWQPQPSAPNNRHTMSFARVLTLKGALTGKAIIIRHP